MCGRNAVFAAEEVLETRFDVTVVEYEPSYNIAPGDPQPVIANNAPDEIRQYRWGLVPEWMESKREEFINARAETANEKPAFREAWQERPCLVLSSGYYEWKSHGDTTKEPYRIHRADDEPFAMAGLWTEGTVDGESIRTVTVLTTEPNDLLSPIHHRMPVVLPDDEYQQYLTGGVETRRRLCRPYPDDDLTASPISTRVNDPSNDDPSIIEPLGNEQAGLDNFSNS